MFGLNVLYQKTDLANTLDPVYIVHMKVDSSHIQKDMNVFTFMLEQMVNETYQNATITTDYNYYGLLTDVWIKFASPDDAVHFKLKNSFNY